MSRTSRTNVTYPGFRDSAELYDFIAHALIAQEKGTVDLITPKYPLWKKLESSGNIVTRSPGQGVTVDVRIKNPEHFTYLSRTQDFQSRDFTEEEVTTVAKYGWVQIEKNVTLREFEVDNANGKAGVYDIVRVKKEAADKGYRNKKVDILWNGLTVGQERIWGINDFNYTPAGTFTTNWTVAENPAAGNVGGIDSTSTLGTSCWYNYAHDWNAAYLTITSGADTAKFTQGANSFQAMFVKLTSAENGDFSEGRPDMIPCNEPGIYHFADLVDRHLLLTNTKDLQDLGIPEAYYYKGAAVFYDPNVGAAPTSGEGKFHFLNTNSFFIAKAEGIGGGWEPVPMSSTGVYFKQKEQFLIAVKDRRMNGVFYGTQNM